MDCDLKDMVGTLAELELAKHSLRMIAEKFEGAPEARLSKVSLFARAVLEKIDSGEARNSIIAEVGKQLG